MGVDNGSYLLFMESTSMLLLLLLLLIPPPAVMPISQSHVNKNFCLQHLPQLLVEMARFPLLLPFSAFLILPHFHPLLFPPHYSASSLILFCVGAPNLFLLLLCLLSPLALHRSLPLFLHLRLSLSPCEQSWLPVAD